MMMTYSAKYHLFFASIAVHFLLLIVLSLYFSKQVEIHRIKGSYVTAYAYNNVISQSNHIKNSQPIKSRSREQAITRENPEVIQHTSASIVLSKPQAKLIHQPEAVNENDVIHRTLLKLLHDEIAAKQVYPENALLLNQTGVVSIGFTLNPDGVITNESILKSSGVSSIDSAALAAVRQVSPLKTADRYLQEKEIFSIDVVFQ
jgi:TonB family protein